MSVSPTPIISHTASPVTRCGLPTTSVTLQHGTPAPIVWTCNPSAAATWRSLHSNPEVATTLTVTLTVDESSPTVSSVSSLSAVPASVDPLTLCDLPTTSMTWDHGTPTPILWSCNPSAAASWNSLHSKPHAATTLTVTRTAGEPFSTSSPGSSLSVAPAPSGSGQSTQSSSSLLPAQTSSDSQSIQSSSRVQSAQTSSDSQSAQTPSTSLSIHSSSSSQSSQSSWSTSTSERSTTSAPHSTTTTYSRNTQSVVAQVTLKAPAKVCTEANLSVQTKMSIPTGSIIIRAGDGWGPEGTIWNITTGRGAVLNNMNAQCQGSSCTGINGDGNKNEDGMMKRRPDGSWYLNVTANMQASLSISGVLAVDPKARKRSHRVTSRETKYPFEIYGYPPCPREVAIKCGSKEFYSTKQWQAFEVDDFMKGYLDEHDLKNMDAFRRKALYDFGDESKAKCDIDSDQAWSCDAPGIHACRFDSKNQTYTKGLLMTKGVVEYTNYMHTLYGKVKESSARISHGINEAILSFYQPAAKSNWDSMMSLVSALVGILTAAAVLITALVPEGSPAIIGAAITAISIGAASGFGIGGTIHSMGNPGETDTLFKESTKYTTAADAMINGIDKGLMEFYKSNTLGQDGIASILKNGGWTGSEVTEFFNAQGNGANITAWFDRVMLSTVITKIMIDNNFYLLHVPYGTSTTYKGYVRYEDKAKKKAVGFTQEECKKRWTANPRWKYYATCDQKYGPDGELGMTLFVRPYKGKSTAFTLDEIIPFNYGGVKFTGLDILQSAMWGQAQHGFNYTFLDRNFTEDLSTQGLSSAQNMYNDLPFNMPGLFTIPVCVVDDLVNVPGIGRVFQDWQGKRRSSGFFHTKDPCSCKDAFAMFPNGTRGNFIDFVNDDVADSLKDCPESGLYRVSKNEGGDLYFGDPGK